MFRLSNAWRVTLIYTVFGVCWILFSDWIVNALFPIETAAVIQTYKGLLYIAITAVLVFWLVFRSDQSLAQSEARYRGLFECSPDAMFVASAEGRILAANDVAVANYGYSHEQFQALTVRELAHSDLRAQVAERLSQATIEGVRFEWRHVRRDGSDFPVEVNARPVTIGEQPLILSIVRDLTERHRAEEERERLETQLRQAQKMEAVGQLAGGVAHDFNNLLQVINGNAELALADLESNHTAREPITEVAEAGQRAARLVSQLLAFSRRQVLTLETLDLNGVVGSILKMIERVIGEHIAIDYVPGYHLGSVRADRGQMEQVLMNLCVNARDAMPEGGRLTIETENVRFDSDYCETHSWASPGRYVMLSVTDTGHGMDAETRARIWEPFFTTKDKGKGTGLGLATVYGIVRQHDGMVQVYSELGQGTVFKVYLPVSERAAADSATTLAGAVPGGSELILLAEDDDTVRSLCVRILERAGYAVVTASDGEGAIRIMNERGSDIRLAILDVVMPRLGGRAVYEEVKDAYPQMRFLFSSGYSANAVHTGFVLDEGIELIQKPFTSEALLRRVRGVLDKK